MSANKNIVVTLYIKDKKAVRSPKDHTEIGNVYELCELYNDSGIDKMIIFDLSDEQEEQERNVEVIKNIIRNVDIKVCAGGNINRIEDVKNLLYAGCLQVILSSSKPTTMELAMEASRRFGKDRILLSVRNIDFIFKNQSKLSDTFHELLLLDETLLDSLENITDVPHVVNLKKYSFENVAEIMRHENVRGITGPFIGAQSNDIMQLKSRLSEVGIKMDNFAPELKWSDLKKNSDGMVPVIVQDYRTDEVLMLAYMDEEAFETTIRIGKMTYYSRSRKELWTKGLTSGNLQYVKSLTADCDYDTILAKVSQVGGKACHTGNRSCFFNSIVQKQYIEKNPLKVLESVYDVISDRKKNPLDGSFTSFLFETGLDKILTHLGEENTELIIAAKDAEGRKGDKEITYEIADLMYSLMVLMVEQGITWEEITAELAQR